MEIIQFEPENKYLRDQFINFPFSLYKEDFNWVPPIRRDIKGIFNRKKHGFYDHGDAQFLLVMENEKPVGRMVTLANFKKKGGGFNSTGHFYLFEVIDDYDIARKMLDRSIAWVKERNITKLFGPKGMTPLDGLGFLVEGFDLRPAFGMPYNLPYYSEFFSRYGFKKVLETGSGLIDNEDFTLPEKVLQAAEIIQRRKGWRVLTCHSRKDLRNIARDLGRLYNEALNDSEESIPLSSGDIKTMVNGLLWIAQPELIKIIVKNEEPIGFLLAYPDISEGLQKTKGRLFPLGWLQLLWQKYHSEWLNINGIGIIEKYRGMAGTALLYSELYKSVKSNPQFKYTEVIQIGFENERMRHELSGMGIEFYKTHALFELEIK
jgi:hypothetical protein